MKVEITRWNTNSKEDKHRKGTIRKCSVDIGYGDDWSVDWLIATVAVPLLKKLKETKQGSPFVDDEDVPEELRSSSCPPKENEWDIDANFHKRWEFALDEIIFAMEEIANDNANEPPFHTKVGEMNFLPIEDGKGTGELELIGWESTPESRAANAAYHKRIENGCRLFGKYFQSLWS